MRITSFFLIAILSVVISGCNISINNGTTTGVPGSGVEKSEDREVDSFTRIEIDGFGDVEIAVGDDPSLSITTDDNLLELIESKVENGVLIIEPKEDISPTIGPVISISTPACERITVGGAADINISDAAGESLEIVVNGAGNVTGTGNVITLNVETNGAGNVDLESLKAESVSISMSGAGSGTVFASQSVDATINGFGSITVHGDPADVKKQINGLGSFNVVE